MTEKRKIICFGDSNTHGYDSQTGGRFTEEERWPCVLQKILGTEYYICEEGLSGRTTVFDDPLTEGLNGLRAITPVLMTHEPVDLLIIMLGTNDTKARFNLSPENIANGLRRLIRKAGETDAWRDHPRILVLCPPPIASAYMNTEVKGDMGQGCDIKSERLGELYRKVSEEYGCAFLDLGTCPEIGMAPYDYMHLSKESHRHLAQELSRMIPELLREN